MNDNIHNLSEWLDENGIYYEVNVNLSKKTWIRNGGMAWLYIVPCNVCQLEDLYIKVSNCGLRYVIVGHTSNLFFANSYNIDVVITTKRLKGFEFKEGSIICECGAPLMKVARECVRRGIAGYEGLVGIPGTVGGAVCNNSGAYGSEMSRIVEWVEVIMDDGRKMRLTNNDMEFSYRNSAIKSGKIRCCILRVELSASQREDPDELLAKAEEYTAIRRRYYEGYSQNLGTVFFNVDLYSGRVILKTLLKIHRYITYPLPLSIQNKTRKFLILAYFNKLNLYPYISDKRMNCFVWNKKRNYSDEIFYDYVKFIKDTSRTEPVLEVQIFDDEMRSDEQNRNIDIP
ncbi:MAG: hypothetical protein Fur0020_00180 [Thermodesulfovibrionia bacterium]